MCRIHFGGRRKLQSLQLDIAAELVFVRFWRYPACLRSWVLGLEESSDSSFRGTAAGTDKQISFCIGCFCEQALYQWLSAPPLSSGRSFRLTLVARVTKLSLAG